MSMPAAPATSPVYAPVPPIEVFAESLSVIPMLHVPANPGIKVLVQGSYGMPLASLALRYPTTGEIRIADLEQTQVPQDRRVSVVKDVVALPEDWKADVAASALPGDPVPRLASMKAHLAKDGVLVVAADKFDRGRAIKVAMQSMWKHVLPYRDWVAGEPSLFLLASDRAFGGFLRPFPSGLRRLTPRYLQVLFTLAKDEYRLLFGSETS